MKETKKIKEKQGGHAEGGHTGKHGSWRRVSPEITPWFLPQGGNQR